MQTRGSTALTRAPDHDLSTPGRDRSLRLIDRRTSGRVVTGGPGSSATSVYYGGILWVLYNNQLTCPARSPAKAPGRADHRAGLRSSVRSPDRGFSPLPSSAMALRDGVDEPGELKVSFRQPTDVMRGKADLHAIVGIVPVWMVTQTLGDQRYLAHESKCGHKILKQQLAPQLPVCTLPQGNESCALRDLRWGQTWGNAHRKSMESRPRLRKYGLQSIHFAGYRSGNSGQLCRRGVTRETASASPAELDVRSRARA